MEQDYYQVLGVDKNASSEEIKRRIVRWPCSIIRTGTRETKEAEQTFKKAAEAYGVLSDSDKKGDTISLD